MEKDLINDIAKQEKQKLINDVSIPRNICKGFNWFLLNTQTIKEDYYKNNKVYRLEVLNLFQQEKIGYDNPKGIVYINVSPLLFKRICISLYDEFGENRPIICPIIIFRFDKWDNKLEDIMKAKGRNKKGRIRYILTTPKNHIFEDITSRAIIKKDYRDINALLK